MKTQLYFTKRFYRGLLNGIATTGIMSFLSDAEAVAWVRGIQANKKRLDYVIEDYSFQKYWRD